MALRRPKSTIAIGLFAMASAIPVGLSFLGGIASYVLHRPVAREMVWPRAGR